MVVLSGLQLFLSRTTAGRQMRATAEDPDTAELVGINARAVYAGPPRSPSRSRRSAGIFLAIRSTFDPSTGPTQLIFAFEAVVIGGFGSLWGTLLGGIVLGVAQMIGAQINPQYFVLSGHLVFLAVLAIAARRHPRIARRARCDRARADAAPGWVPRPALDARLDRVRRGHGRGHRRALPSSRSCSARTSTEQLTALLIFVILAVMWNALAGYGGLVSVGQQAFIGLGAYGTIFLTQHGFDAVPRDGRRGARRGRGRDPASRWSCCACAAASSRSACGCSPRCSAFW